MLLAKLVLHHGGDEKMAVAALAAAVFGR